jgi:hypothetical protein
MHSINVAFALPPILVISVVKHRYQWAGLELLRDGRHILQALRFAERPQKTPALRPRLPKGRPLGKNYRPGHDAEYQQYYKDHLRHGPGLPYQVENLSANKRRQNGSTDRCYAGRDHRREQGELCIYHCKVNRLYQLTLPTVTPAAAHVKRVNTLAKQGYGWVTGGV